MRRASWLLLLGILMLMGAVVVVLEAVADREEERMIDRPPPVGADGNEAPPSCAERGTIAVEERLREPAK